MLIESDTVLPATPTRLSEPTLFAVLRGHAHIHTDGSEHRVTAGTALWVPAGTHVAVTARADTVVLPVLAHAAGPSSPTLVAFTPEQLPGLLHEFSCALGHLDGPHQSAVAVRTGVAGPLAAPPAPRSDDLQQLAELLADDPDLNLADAVDAAVAGWSVRTVQRRFHAETGLTLSAWVRRARISAAAELLARGRDIEWVAHRVGYRSTVGFSRSFTELAGVAPGAWRRATHSTTPGAPELRVPQSWEQRTQHTWQRVNGAHVALWAADGPAHITVGTQAFTLRAGEAVILPAGVRNSVRIPPGSLLLPVGFRSGARGPIGTPAHPAHIGGLESLDTVAAMLAAYTRIGPPGADPDTVFARILATSTQHPVDTTDALMARLASLVSRAPDTTTAASAARSLGTSERMLRHAVRERSGEAFPAWLRRSRMTRARTSLGLGASPSEISRTLGYAHLPAFSRAFRAVHGTGPAALDTAEQRAARDSWGRQYPTHTSPVRMISKSPT